MRLSAALSAALLALATLALGCGDARRSLARSAENENRCVACHGGQDNQTGAPPADLAGASDTSLGAVGAHTAHVQTAALALPFGCAECHEDVPQVVSSGHMNGTVDLPFGALSRTGGATPVFDRSAMTCATTYCHGATLQGGTNTAPVWTRVGQGEAACGSCHGLPPATVAGSAKHPASPAVTDCHRCHPGTVDETGAILVSGGLHVDGMVEVQGMSCVTCHGGQDNQTGAPPLDLAGSSDTAERGVGAHTAHVQTAALALPFACTECHEAVPQVVTAGHMNGAVDLPFGALSRTGGATAAFDAGAMTCASYCHGATLQGGTHTAPVWNRVGQGEASCGSCHGLPPATVAGGASHPTGYTLAECFWCHPGTVSPAGTILVSGGLHVDGKVEEGAHASVPDWFVDPDVNPAFTPRGGLHGHAASADLASCKACHGATLDGASGIPSCNACHSSHGFTTWQTNCVFCHGDRTQTATQASPLYAAPPLGTQGETATTEPAVGAHQSHLTAPHGLSSAVACTECHTVPADISSPTHVNGAVDIAWGTLATTGGVSPTFVAATPGCAATYCHGNFVGGNNATPTWTDVGNAATLACTTCHGITGNATGIEPRTGRHPTNWADHEFMGNRCQYCHSTVASASTATATPTVLSTGKALHVNGTKDVSFSGGGNWDPVNKTCSNIGCHGNENW